MLGKADDGDDDVGSVSVCVCAPRVRRTSAFTLLLLFFFFLFFLSFRILLLFFIYTEFVLKLFTFCVL